MKKWDVINMGIIVVDVPVRIPAKVLDFQTDTLRSQDISILPGGDAANSSLVLSRLGKKTALCGRYGVP